MALYGVIADIHGNHEALTAVLAQLDRCGARRLLCLGDIVGYNADSDACAELMRSRNAVAVAGNHDLISIRRLGFNRCANKVIYSLKQTRRGLAPDTAAYLGSLPTSHVLEGRFLLVHAGVRDVEQYVTAPRHIAQNAAYLRADFPGLNACFFGHVHVQRVYEVDGENVREVPSHAPVTLRPDRLYFINPGSVDAARKSEDKLAEFALFDSTSLRIEFRRIAYDDAAAEAKAAAGGFRINSFTDRLYTLQRKIYRLAAKIGNAGARS